MTHQRGFTANSSSVKDLADLALDQADGIEVTWFAKDIGLAACAHNARSFQTTFTSLRARARRMALKFHTESANALDLSARGAYDKLACVRQPLDDGAGWSVSLVHAHMLLAGVTITNAATGEPIAELDPSRKRLMAILMKAQRFPAQVTQEEYDFALTCDPTIWNMDEGEPWFVLHPSQVVHKHVDLVEAPAPRSASEMFGGKVK